MPKGNIKFQWKQYFNPDFFCQCKNDHFNVFLSDDIRSKGTTYYLLMCQKFASLLNLQTISTVLEVLSLSLIYEKVQLA